MICYVPGRICFGSENFGLGSLHDDCVCLVGATSQFCYVLCLYNSKGNEQICNLTENMEHIFQQSYVENNKTFFNKYICTQKERMYLLTRQMKIVTFL
jgi:hypothetical protein